MALGRFRGATYLATEYVSGPTLERVLNRAGALDWPEAVGVGLQICDALIELHRLDVVHRNLKPSHLIRTQQGQLKMIGFGMAKSLAEFAPSGPGLARGTPGYMAPEQICGSHAIGPRTDLYALGVVLWHLLTGEEPYRELWDAGHTRGGATLAFAHLTQPLSRPSAKAPGIPHLLDELVVKLMAKRPLDRPKDAKEVARTLWRLQKEGMGAPSSGRPVDERDRRHPEFLAARLPDGRQPWTE